MLEMILQHIKQIYCIRDEDTWTLKKDYMWLYILCYQMTEVRMKLDNWTTLI